MENATSVASTATERHTVGETKKNRKVNKTARKTLFNGKYKNFGKIGHMASHCWAKTEKEKYDDVDNQIMGAALYG